MSMMALFMLLMVLMILTVATFLTAIMEDSFVGFLFSITFAALLVVGIIWANKAWLISKQNPIYTEYSVYDCDGVSLIFIDQKAINLNKKLGRNLEKGQKVYLKEYPDALNIHFDYREFVLEKSKE